VFGSDSRVWFSSALSRLNFFPKPPPSLLSALTTFRRNQLPLKSSLATLKRDGDVVVLGIETSCDDTTAVVVSNLSFAFFHSFLFFCVWWFGLSFNGFCVCCIGEKWRWNSQPSSVFSGMVSYCMCWICFHGFSQSSVKKLWILVKLMLN